MDTLSRYIAEGYKSVHGWLSKDAIQIITLLANKQGELGVGGSVGEIGVQHGRLFILLHLLMSQGEKSIAVDLFDQQSENEDGSGRGDEALFRKNLKKWGCNISQIEIIKKNSLDVNSNFLLAALKTKARLFSVDGGHTKQIVFHDVETVMGILCEGGISFIDDYLTPYWPEVSEGVLLYLLKNQDGVYPIAIGGGKLFLTNSEFFANKYIEALVQSNLARYKVVNLIKKPCLAIDFRTDIVSRVRQTSAWSHINNTKIGTQLKSMYRRFFE